MARRSFIFCDICNPLAICYIEMRRVMGRDSRIGRRLTDGRNWFDSTDDEAEKSGWITTEEGQHVGPACFGRMKSMRHILEDRQIVSRNLNQIQDDEANF